MLSVNVSIDFSSLMWNVAFIVCICIYVVSSSVYFFSSACRHKCSTVFPVFNMDTTDIIFDLLSEKPLILLH